MEAKEKLFEYYKRKNEESERIISSLKITLRNIYESIECQPDNNSDKMNMITKFDILKYLSDIEDRANEILIVYELCKNKVKSVVKISRRLKW